MLYLFIFMFICSSGMFRISNKMRNKFKIQPINFEFYFYSNSRSRTCLFVCFIVSLIVLSLSLSLVSVSYTYLQTFIFTSIAFICESILSIGVLIRKKRAMSDFEIPEFHADHPFIYIIRHISPGGETTPISLFLGTLNSLDATVASDEHDEL